MHKKTSQTTQKPEFRQILSQRSATFQTGALNILGQISHTLRKTHFFFVPFTKKQGKAGDKHTHVHTQQVLWRGRKFENLDPRAQATPTYVDHTPRPPNRASTKKRTQLELPQILRDFPQNKKTQDTSGARKLALLRRRHGKRGNAWSLPSRSFVHDTCTHAFTHKRYGECLAE